MKCSCFCYLCWLLLLLLFLLFLILVKETVVDLLQEVHKQHMIWAEEIFTFCQRIYRFFLKKERLKRGCFVSCFFFFVVFLRRILATAEQVADWAEGNRKPVFPREQNRKSYHILPATKISETRFLRDPVICRITKN